MDTTGTIATGFDKLLEKAMHTSPESGGYELAISLTFVGLALCIAGGVWLVKVLLNYRDRKDAEATAREDDLRSQLATNAKDAKAEARAESDRVERLARESRDREEAASRERARADQADRESAREKLVQHVSGAIDKLRDWLMPLVGRMESAIGALQGKFDAHDRDFVSLKKDMEHLLERIKKLEEDKK